MIYGTYEDVQKRLGTIFSEQEKEKCEVLLEDASVLIDATSTDASPDVKTIVACRMVMRAIGSCNDAMPLGATQGSMSALGYSQSWTMSNGATGELYIAKSEKKLLGLGNRIGSKSPLEVMS